MFRGTVNFAARIEGNRFSFPTVEVNPHVAGVEKIEIGSLEGTEIRSTVHLTGVATQTDGRNLATHVNASALNRLAFHHNLSIENARRTGDQFVEMDAPPGTVAISVTHHLHLSGSADAMLAIPGPQIKNYLEQASPPGERHFGLFRSARQSDSLIEEFMHLYNVLLMLYHDRQADVDAFIRAEEPAVPQSQHPMKAAGTMETIYTRLRNELAHQRAGVNLADTKDEMTHRVSDLRALTKRAMELHP